MQVDNVDLTVRPYSYGILLDGSDHYRETESPRLRPYVPGTPPPADAAPSSLPGQPNAPHAPAQSFGFDADDDEDDFGDFSGASDFPAEPASMQPAPQQPTFSTGDDPVDWSATVLRPHTATAAFSTTAQPNKGQPGSATRNTAKSAFQPSPAEDLYDDDFGDFAAAEEEADFGDFAAAEQDAKTPEPEWGVSKYAPPPISKLKNPAIFVPCNLRCKPL